MIYQKSIILYCLVDVIRLKLNSASDLSSSESNTSKSSSTSSGKRQKSGSDSDWDDSDLDDPLELLSFVGIIPLPNASISLLNPI